MYSQEVENEGAQWFLLSKLKRDLWGVCSICCLMIHAGSKQRVRALDGLIEVRKQSTGDVSELLIRTLCGIGIVSPSPPCCAAHLTKLPFAAPVVQASPQGAGKHWEAFYLRSVSMISTNCYQNVLTSVLFHSKENLDVTGTFLQLQLQCVCPQQLLKETKVLYCLNSKLLN